MDCAGVPSGSSSPPPLPPAPTNYQPSPPPLPSPTEDVGETEENILEVGNDDQAIVTVGEGREIETGYEREGEGKTSILEVLVVIDGATCEVVDAKKKQATPLHPLPFPGDTENGSNMSSSSSNSSGVSNTHPSDLLQHQPTSVELLEISQKQRLAKKEREEKEKLEKEKEKEIGREGTTAHDACSSISEEKKGKEEEREEDVKIEGRELYVMCNGGWQALITKRRGRSLEEVKNEEKKRKEEAKMKKKAEKREQKLKKEKETLEEKRKRKEEKEAKKKLKKEKKARKSKNKSKDDGNATNETETKKDTEELTQKEEQDTTSSSPTTPSSLSSSSSSSDTPPPSVPLQLSSTPPADPSPSPSPSSPAVPARPPSAALLPNSPLATPSPPVPRRPSLPPNSPSLSPPVPPRPPSAARVNNPPLGDSNHISSNPANLATSSSSSNLSSPSLPPPPPVPTRPASYSPSSSRIGAPVTMATNTNSSPLSSSSSSSSSDRTSLALASSNSGHEMTSPVTAAGVQNGEDRDDEGCWVFLWVVGVVTHVVVPGVSVLYVNDYQYILPLAPHFFLRLSIPKKTPQRKIEALKLCLTVFNDMLGAPPVPLEERLALASRVIDKRSTAFRKNAAQGALTVSSQLNRGANYIVANTDQSTKRHRTTKFVVHAATVISKGTKGASSGARNKLESVGEHVSGAVDRNVRKTAQTALTTKNKVVNRARAVPLIEKKLKKREFDQAWKKKRKEQLKQARGAEEEAEKSIIGRQVPRIHAAIALGRTIAKSAGEIKDSLEEAQEILGDSAQKHSIKVISHVCGKDVGEAAEDSILLVKNVYKTFDNIQTISGYAHSPKQNFAQDIAIGTVKRLAQADKQDDFEKPIKEGFLMKRGKFVDFWKQKYFVLKPRTLQFYDQKPKNKFEDSKGKFKTSEIVVGSFKKLDAKPMAEENQKQYGRASNHPLLTAGSPSSSPQATRALSGSLSSSPSSSSALALTCGSSGVAVPERPLFYFCFSTDDGIVWYFGARTLKEVDEWIDAIQAQLPKKE